MKVIVYPHDMEIGGSQINAIELAGALSRRGHEVLVFGGPGRLSETVADLGLELVLSPALGRRPSPAVSRALIRLVRDRGVDVVHAYEWPPSLEAAFGPHLRDGTTVVSTVMSMGVAPFLPKDIPVVVGTESIRDHCLAARRPLVHLLEPPIDTVANAPAAVSVADRQAFDARLHLRADEFTIVLVSRLAVELKREGILAAVDATERLASSRRVRLIVVGDGPARPEIEARARAVNARLGREVVTLLGALMDPRPAYGRADVVLGMGSSALRGMAFAKPLLVQGERGYWELLSETTLPTFLRQGWYGVGDGTDGSGRLEQLLANLADDAQARQTLGAFARDVVVSRFGLDRAAALQETWYEEARARRSTPTSRVRAAFGSSAGLVTYKLNRRYERFRGTAALDDFNAIATQPAELVDSARA
jgi:glycosyltransferase involved in cell wall biosynthesis